MTKQEWKDNLASLHLRIADGDAQAMWELGSILQDGIQDRNGRSLIRRNPKEALRVWMRAADLGHEWSLCSLANAYDLGLCTKKNEGLALKLYRRAARTGSSLASGNIAVIYRDRRQYRTAFKWWKQAARLRDGDAAVDVAYCYYYGIGVKRSVANARRLLRRAMVRRRSGQISEYSREEAMYCLAVMYCDAGKSELAIPLLKSATVDGAYPEAQRLLDQIEANKTIVPCRCRRGLLKTLPGHAPCPVHARYRRK
jgi:uncharacterized protein